MDNSIKLKAIALLIGTGIAGGAIAADNAGMNTTNGMTNVQEAPQTPQANQENQQSDAQITENVNQVLADYSGKVDTKVNQSVVYLSGELPSDTDYEKVITLTESVKGVSDVNVDKLTVKDSKRPLYDTYITAKVKGALIQSDLMGTDIPSWTISVETKNGEVFLSGKVASEEERQNILKVVNSVNGVKQVDDKMVVQADDGQDEGAATTDDSGTAADDNEEAEDAMNADETNQEGTNGTY